MQTQNLQVDAVSTINYQFTAIPTNFIYLMDNDCFKLFSILLQKETYWNNKGKLNNGYFIKSITELSDELGLTNRKDVHTIIEALYIRNIIDVVVEPRKFKTAKFKLNWEIINSYLDKSIYDLLEFEDKITKLNRNSNITYKDNVTANVTSNVTNNVTKCNTTKDNINNINKKNNIYNNINKNNINIYNNILEENSEEIGFGDNPISENKEFENYEKIEEVGLVENPTSDKIEIEDNNTFQLCEVGMLEEINDTPMKESFRINLQDCLNRLGDGCTTVAQLEEKTIKLNNWINNHQADYSKEEQEIIFNQLADRFNELEEAIIEKNNQLEVIQDDMFSSMVLDSNSAKSLTQIKEEQEKVKVQTTSTIAKEELTDKIQSFIDYIPTFPTLDDAKQTFHSYCKMYNTQIREYNLFQVVNVVNTEIDAYWSANKAFLTTFSLQDKETYYNEEIMQENALKSISYKVDDTEDYPF